MWLPSGPRLVGEKRLNFRATQLQRVLFVVEEDETLYPVNVVLLRANRMVLEADGITNTSTSLVQAWSSNLLGGCAIFVPVS